MAVKRLEGGGVVRNLFIHNGLTLRLTAGCGSHAIVLGSGGGCGRDRSPVRRRRGLAVVIAAASLVVAVAGLGFAVHAATPGDPLWGVSEVVFSQRAASVHLHLR